MIRTILAVTASMALTTAVVTNAWLQKKQFYPTVVHLTRSNQSMLILYIQAFVLVFLFAKLLGKVFFGTLRQAEAENLMERTWYAIIDTCLAFTMFREDLSPGFIAAFTIFFLLKGFHWLCEDRVDFMERSPVITLVFKVRIITLLCLLSLADSFAIWYAYERTMAKGATVQLVFGFEYAILLTIAGTAFVKFVLHSIDLRSEDPWENKSMYMLYLDLVMSFMRLVLYAVFICIMFKVHTLPIFALRPMYLAIRTFRKALSDIILSRRAIAQLDLYPNATQEELANDNTCIICREEMMPGASAKKLPCGHIFHAACLRSWFQRQQTCPTCRLDVLRARTPQQRQNEQQRRQAQLVQLRDQLRNQGLGNLVPELNNALNLEQDGVPPAPGAAAMPEPVAAVHQDDLNLPNLQIPAGLGHLGNILQIPNMLHGLNADPLPPPPPMPPVDLSKLSQGELELMESVERKGLEARVRHLREIRVLLDAAVLRMDEYMRVAPSEGFTRLDHMRPTSSTADNTNAASGDFQSAKDETPKSEKDTAQTKPLPKVQTSTQAESENVDQTNQNAASDITSNVQELENSPANSESGEDPRNADELRRRRLQALDNSLDLD